MKKIIIALFLVTVLILVNNKETEVLIPKEAIRFRIIANSNKLEDQTQKLEIKKELEPVIANILSTSNSLDETRKEIKNNMYEVKNILNKYDTDYKLNYGYNYFPEKNYKGVTYKSGEYESLVVTLGDGLGDNWWCVLFPPLCLLEASEEDYDDVTYTSYIKELIDKY
mgnify:FL=1